MSTQTIFASPVVQQVPDAERAHRIRLRIGYLISISLIGFVLFYGMDYYRLSVLERPFSPQHKLLRPSGKIGVDLGIVGLCMFCVIFLYPIRKRWGWLQRQGNTRHWLDFHILLGISAPFVIALHSSFKFQGFAGMAFWIMVSVSLSGVIGRYLYAQIPRRVNSAELSMKESRELQAKIVQEVSQQKLISTHELRPLFRLPTEQQVTRLPVVVSLLYMIMLDLARPFHIAALRMRKVSFWGKIITVGGVFSTGHPELESVIRIAREQASLSKRILFLSRAQQVFHLWHVVHKPFSYSFVVLAIIHIAVVMGLGFA
jgi:hypothetical protein